MKPLLTVPLAIALIWMVNAPVSSGADDPKPTTSEAIDAIGFFQIGELQELSRWAYFYQVTGARLADRFSTFESDCKRLGAPAEVLDDLAAVRKSRLSLSFLSKPMMSWTPEELQQWNNAPNLHDELWTKWLDKPDYAPRFFWHLGRLSICGWFIVGRDILERGASISASERNLRDLTRIAGVLSNDVGYEKARARLAPQAASALKTIADLNAPLDDPFIGTLTLDQVRSFDSACETLRDLARARTLVVDPGPRTP